MSKSDSCTKQPPVVMELTANTLHASEKGNGDESSRLSTYDRDDQQHLRMLQFNLTLACSLKTLTPSFRHSTASTNR